MPVDVELDHTSIATRDAGRWLAWITRELGAVPVMGETLPDFRYVMCWVGDDKHGNGLELMDPLPGNRDFLSRFVAEHGESAHHLTFFVPDLEQALQAVADLGLTPVQVDGSNPAWREAFLLPEPVHGVVIQLGQTDGLSEPFHRLGSDRSWWRGHVRPPARSAVLAETILRSTDLDASMRLFGGAFGGTPDRLSSDRVRFTWRRGSLVVQSADTPGISHLTIAGGPADEFLIADTRCVGPRA